MLTAFACAALMGCSSTGPEYRGVSYTAWSESAYSSALSDDAIRQMWTDGVNTVAVNVWEFQDTINSAVIKPDYTRYSASPDSVRHAIRLIHRLGMKVMLKPIVDPLDGHWRGEIPPSVAWFRAYQGFIDGWAELAAQEHVELFSVGCELKLTQTWTDAWRQVVRSVRSAYGGKLTYSANFDSWTGIGWWDSVDLIGIDAYFALTDHANPSLAEVISSWDSLANTIESWRAANEPSKQVAFTEVGYCSFPGTNEHPWQYPGSPPDMIEQANCYRALLQVFWYKSWWAGAFWWNWETNPHAGGPSDTGYTPQNKPAEAAIRAYYRGRP